MIGRWLVACVAVGFLALLGFAVNSCTEGRVASERWRAACVAAGGAPTQSTYADNGKTRQYERVCLSASAIVTVEGAK